MTPIQAGAGSLVETETELLALIAYLHLRYGDHSKARAYLKVLARLRPEDPVIDRSLALLHLREGDAVRAEEAATRSLEKSGDDTGKAASHLMLGMARSRMNRTDLSEASFSEFRKLRGQTAPVE